MKKKIAIMLTLILATGTSVSYTHLIQIVKDSETKDEAVEKLQNLVKGKEN